MNEELKRVLRSSQDKAAHPLAASYALRKTYREAIVNMDAKEFLAHCEMCNSIACVLAASKNPELRLVATATQLGLAYAMEVADCEARQDDDE